MLALFVKRLRFRRSVIRVTVDRKFIIMPMLGLRAPERVKALGIKV